MAGHAQALLTEYAYENGNENENENENENGIGNEITA
jgi:hypothetical protein